MTTSKKNSNRRAAGPAKPQQNNARKRKPKSAGSGQRAPHAAHVRQLVAMSNPFAASALGVKYPDASAMRTLTVPIHARAVMRTDGNGNSAMLFIPNWLYKPANVGIVDNVTRTAAYPIQSLASRLPNVNNVRIVNYGVITRGISAKLYQQGMVRYRGFPAKKGGALVNIPIEAYLCDYYEDVPLGDNHEVATVLRRTDIQAELFSGITEISPGPLVADWVSPGFGALQITVTGGPVDTDVLDIEIRANMEVTFIDEEATAILATQAPEYHAPVINAHKHASSKMPAVFKKGAKHVSDHVAKQAVESIGAALGNYLAPGGGKVARALIRDVD